MISPGVTPVEVWAPAFAWEPDERLFTVDRLLTLRRAGGVYCLLCEGTVEIGERKAHVRKHRSEVIAYRRGTAKRQQREAAARLRQINRLKRETERVVGAAR